MPVARVIGMSARPAIRRVRSGHLCDNEDADGGSALRILDAVPAESGDKMNYIDFVPKPLKVEALYFAAMSVAVVAFSYLMGGGPINGYGIFWLVYYLVSRVYWRYQTKWIPRPKTPAPEPTRYTHT